jgi:hypothetical protein
MGAGSFSFEQELARMAKLLGLDQKKAETKGTKMAKDNFANTDIEIVKQGTQIVLPKDPKEMTTAEAITALERLMEAEETVIGIHEEVQAYPLDGAYALMKALKQIYGWANAVPKPGFFGPKPPVTANLEVNFGESVQVIWGQFQVPNIEGRLETGQDQAIW